MFFVKNINKGEKMNRINLNNYNIRTDLILETINNNNYIKEEKIENITVSRVEINKENKKIINKKEGNYITIEFEDITNYEDREKVGKYLEKEIKYLLEINNINKDDEGLIIGLGNNKSTADALGPKTLENILVTRHLFLLNTNVKEGMRKISAITPGVMGNTGIETIDIINGVICKIKPKFIIVIDSLCASSVERLNKTIQLTDTGIHPGSGIGNNRKEISKEILNIPVIAIGVPTVVDASTIVNDTINYLFMHLSYLKNNYETNKLIVKRFDNYLEKIKNRNLTKEERNLIGGIIGNLNDKDKLSLINEVLESINYNLIVTPKEIDFLIDKLSDLISSSINNALHDSVNNY